MSPPSRSADTQGFRPEPDRSVRFVISLPPLKFIDVQRSCPSAFSRSAPFPPPSPRMGQECPSVSGPPISCHLLVGLNGNVQCTYCGPAIVRTTPPVSRRNIIGGRWHSPISVWRHILLFLIIIESVICQGTKGQFRCTYHTTTNIF